MPRATSSCPQGNGPSRAMEWRLHDFRGWFGCRRQTPGPRGNRDISKRTPARAGQAPLVAPRSSRAISRCEHIGHQLGELHEPAVAGLLVLDRGESSARLVLVVQVQVNHRQAGFIRNSPGAIAGMAVPDTPGAPGSRAVPCSRIARNWRAIRSRTTRRALIPLEPRAWSTPARDQPFSRQYVMKLLTHCIRSARQVPYIRSSANAGCP